MTGDPQFVRGKVKFAGLTPFVRDFLAQGRGKEVREQRRHSTLFTPEQERRIES